MQLFRGYVPTKDKACLVKFKGKELRTLEQVEDLDEYAGILGPETVLVDVDDEEQSEKLMRMVEDKQLDCRVLQTTRGRHFYFKNTNAAGDPIVTKCGNAKRLACGLTADIKTGLKNSYAILKFDGEERFVEWDVEEGDDYQALPAFLRPVESKMDFLDMEEGQGRNNALFSYILTLQSSGFTVEECRETIRAINGWVIEEPLDEDEVEKILRDDSFKTDVFFVNGAFKHERFGDFLRSKYGVVLIDGALHVYENGVYLPDQRKIERAMVRHIKGIKDSQRSEVLKYLRLVCDEVKATADANLVAFQNGLLDLETGKMRPFDPGMVLTNRVACDYNPGAYSEAMDKTLDRLACGDKKIRALIEECAGYCLYRRNELGKAFVLTGEKNNGKSTFLEIVTTMLGDENVTNLDLNEFGDRFKTACLQGKLANIGDDISDEFMKGASVAMFKKIVTGSRVTAEHKGQDPFEFRPYVKVLFSANDIPRMRDKTGAVLRRLVIVPFNARFSSSDPDFDPFIIYKLKEKQAIEYFAALAVEGLRRVLKERKFTESEKVTEEIKEYQLENDPALLFYEDTERESVENESTADVYRRYTLFCAENGYTPLSAAAFVKKTNAHYGFRTGRKRIDGARVRVFEDDPKE